MTKKFAQQWLIFAFCFYILMGFTSGRFATYVSDQSRILIDILISIFPSFVLALPLAYLSTKYIFKNKSFSRINFGERRIYKRLLANLLDSFILYTSFTIFNIPVVIFYFSKIINVYTTLTSFVFILLFIPTFYFFLCWKNGGTIGYRLLKIKLTFHKENYFLRAVAKSIMLPFHIFSLAVITISLLSSEGKKDALDFIFQSKVE